MDFCNKSPDTGAELNRTISYLTSHGLGALKELDLLYIYHLVTDFCI